MDLKRSCRPLTVSVETEESLCNALVMLRPVCWLLTPVVLVCIVEAIATSAQPQFEWCSGHIGRLVALLSREWARWGQGIPLKV